MIHTELMNRKKINKKLLHEKAFQNDSAPVGWGFILRRLRHSRRVFHMRTFVCGG